MLYMQVEINLCQEYEMKDIYFFFFMFCMQEEIHLCQKYVLKDIYFFCFKLCMQVEIHLCWEYDDHEENDHDVEYSEIQ